MNSRNDVIEYFRKLGYRALFRDWSMGETICIPTGKRIAINKEAEAQGRFAMSQGVLYLYPLEAGKWALNIDCQSTIEDNIYPALQEAVYAAEKIVRERNTDFD